MTERLHSDRAAKQRAAIARDIEATIGRLTRDDDMEERDRSSDEIVTVFLESIELNDKIADALWTQLPPSEAAEDELVAIVHQVVGRAQRPLQAGDDDASHAFKGVSEGARIARKLRGPRHPFE
jgi:hypothetical protein